MVPLGHGGDDEALEIGQDRFHRFALFGTAGRQRVGEFAGLHGRQHGIAPGVLQKRGDPFDRLVAMAAEFVRCHG